MIGPEDQVGVFCPSDSPVFLPFYSRSQDQTGLSPELKGPGYYLYMPVQPRDAPL